MRFLELKKRVGECIKHGDFTMSSGQKTKWMCDLLECRDLFPYFMEELGLTNPHGLFGMETGGYLLAREVDTRLQESKNKAELGISLIRKTGELYLGQNSYVTSGGSNMSVRIIDDVVSTEKTFSLAIDVLNKNKINGGRTFYAVLDRRAKKDVTLKVTSLFTPQDFGLKP